MLDIFGTNIIHPRHESIAGPPHVSSLLLMCQTWKQVFSIIGPYTGWSSLVLFPVGMTINFSSPLKERWVVVEVVMTEGAVRMGLRPAVLRSPPLLFSEIEGAFHIVAGVPGGLRSIDQRCYHAANTSSTALGHKRLFITGSLVPNLWVFLWCATSCW